MFHKQDSSVLSKGKKSVDVSLRKSDCKNLLRQAECLLLDSNTNNENNVRMILQAVFLEGSLIVRKLEHPILHKVTLYYRSPSPYPDKKNKKNETTLSTLLCPYTCTTQCVWMTVDAGPSSQVIHAPTVALLSVLPSITNLATVMVSSQVSKFLCRGAHLMRAGMKTLPSSNCNWNNVDGIVAIQVQGNPQPFAIGQITKDTTLETIGANASGVGVTIWTCYGDDIWKQQQRRQVHSSFTQEEGIMNPIGGASFDNGNYGNVGFIEGKIVRPIVAVESNDDSDESSHGQNVGVNGMDNKMDKVESCAVVDHSLETQEKDETEATNNIHHNDTNLHRAVCQALVNIKDSQLPMTSSHFYAQHVKPRSETPIEIKSTLWKKFNTYLQAQQERDLLFCKAHGTDPMGYLVDINRKHKDLQGIQKDAVPQRDTKTISLVNLYVVPHHFVKLLRLDSDTVKAINAKSEERRGTGMLTRPEARAILEQYITDNELSLVPNCVQLDGALTDALFRKQNAPTSLSKKEIYDLWIDKMEPAHAFVEMPGNHIKLHRGLPPKVLIEVSQRQGRKKYSTKVRGLEDYDIDPVQFQKDVTKRFACAGTVETEPEKRAALKKGHVELDFQGYWAEELRALLVGDEKLTSHGGAKDSSYCLPKSAIEVTLKKNVPKKKPNK